MSAIKQKLHSVLGASTASRWMSCPGSVMLSENAPPRPESEHARLGTSAHGLAEICLSRKQDPATYVGTEIEGIAVTEEMAEFVSVFVDYCRSREFGAVATFVEQQFSLAGLNPPAPMFGTADFVVVADGVLEIVDLKYGTGVVVDVNENKQLRYYALGCLLMVPDAVRSGITQVRITIVQPRAAHPDGVIRSEVLSVSDVVGFANELLDAARAALTPGAPLVPGSHCRWCPASGLCPAQRERALVQAQEDFSTALVVTDGKEPVLPPEPGLVPLETLAEYAARFHVLEEWMSAVRARIKGELEAGRGVPGWKLIAKRATRKWAEPALVGLEQWLRANGASDEDLFVKELRSPAQMEKQMKKLKGQIPAEYISKVSTGTNLVPETNPHPAVPVGPGVDFALTAGQ